MPRIESAKISAAKPVENNREQNLFATGVIDRELPNDKLELSTHKKISGKKKGFFKTCLEKSKPFFNLMEKWSKPYFDGDGKLSFKEKAINTIRGIGAIITEALSSPKKAAFAIGGTAGILAAGAFMVGVMGLSLPLLLAGASLFSAGCAVHKFFKARHEFKTADGDEEKLAKAFFTSGEVGTDIAVAGWTGVVGVAESKHALRAGNLNLLNKIGYMLKFSWDNGVVNGAKMAGP